MIKIKPLNEATFKKFVADELTVKEVKSLTVSLNERFKYIIEKIAELTGRSVAWFDYGNNNYDKEYGDSNSGFFDTDQYHTNVSYIGEFFVEKKQAYLLQKYDNEFPTKWFYQNFENTLENEIAEFIIEENNKTIQKTTNKNKAKEDLQKVQESIRKKLTKEELSYISFVSIEAVRENKKIMNKSVSAEVSKFVKEMKENGIIVSKKYEEYRQGKNKAKDFETWVLKNMTKIRDSLENI